MTASKVPFPERALYREALRLMDTGYDLLSRPRYFDPKYEKYGVKQDGDISPREFDQNLKKIWEDPGFKTAVVKQIETFAKNSTQDGKITKRELFSYLSADGQFPIDENAKDFFGLQVTDETQWDDTVDITNLFKTNPTNSSELFFSSFIAFNQLIKPPALMRKPRHDFWQEDDVLTPESLDTTHIDQAYSQGRLLDFADQIDNQQQITTQELNELEWNFDGYLTRNEEKLTQADPKDFISLSKNWLQDPLAFYTALRTDDPQSYHDLALCALLVHYLHGKKIEFKTNSSISETTATPPKADCNTFVILATHLLSLMGIDEERLKALVLPGNPPHAALALITQKGEVYINFNFDGRIEFLPPNYFNSQPHTHIGWSPRGNESFIPAKYSLSTIIVEQANTLLRQERHTKSQTPPLDQAIALYEAALLINPHDAATEYNLALALIQMEDSENPNQCFINAEKHLRRSVAINLNFLEPLPTLAISLSCQKKYDEAIQYFENYINRYPRDFEGLLPAIKISKEEKMKNDLSNAYYNLALTNLQMAWDYEDQLKESEPTAEPTAEQITELARRYWNAEKNHQIAGLISPLSTTDRQTFEQYLPEGKTKLKDLLTACQQPLSWDYIYPEIVIPEVVLLHRVE